MNNCPCGRKIEYAACCGVYHKGEKVAPTPEALMRSRYTAYALGDIAYIKKTMQGKPLVGFNTKAVEAWANSVEWVGLRVVQVKNVSSELGYVEFIARYIEHGKNEVIHECSEFKCIDGQWLYVDGTPPTPNTSPEIKKVGRNMPCPCGSQKKFKHCHGK